MMCVYPCSLSHANGVWCCIAGLMAHFGTAKCIRFHVRPRHLHYFKVHPYLLAMHSMNMCVSPYGQHMHRVLHGEPPRAMRSLLAHGQTLQDGIHMLFFCRHQQLKNRTGGAAHGVRWYSLLSTMSWSAQCGKVYLWMHMGVHPVKMCWNGMLHHCMAQLLRLISCCTSLMARLVSTCRRRCAERRA